MAYPSFPVRYPEGLNFLHYGLVRKVLKEKRVFSFLLIILQSILTYKENDMLSFLKQGEE